MNLSNPQPSVLATPPRVALRERLLEHVARLSASGDTTGAAVLHALVEGWWRDQTAWSATAREVLRATHEINNALVGVSGNAQLLLLGPLGQQNGVCDRLRRGHEGSGAGRAGGAAAAALEERLRRGSGDEALRPLHWETGMATTPRTPPDRDDAPATGRRRGTDRDGERRRASRSLWAACEALLSAHEPRALNRALDDLVRGVRLRVRCAARARTRRELQPWCARGAWSGKPGDLRACLTVPLLRGSERVGSLALRLPAGRTWTPASWD